MKPWRLISYFTRQTGYAAEAIKLAESCDVLGIPYNILGVENRGSWHKNTAMKAEFIYEMLETLADAARAVVFVDADAQVRRYPDFFDSLDVDMGLAYRDYRVFPSGPRKAGKELLSGTIYVANTSVSRAILRAWMAENAIHPTTWEQRNLQAVVDRLEPAFARLAELPPTYCQIFDSMRTAGPAVIEHFQKSRVYRAQVNRFTGATFAGARLGRMLQTRDIH